MYHVTLFWGREYLFTSPSTNQRIGSNKLKWLEYILDIIPRQSIFCTYLLAMWTIERLLPHRQQLFHEAKLKDIVAVQGRGDKLAIVKIVSKWVFDHTEENAYFLEGSDSKFNVLTRITSEMFRVWKRGKFSVAGKYFWWLSTIGRYSTRTILRWDRIACLFAAILHGKHSLILYVYYWI